MRGDIGDLEVNNLGEALMHRLMPGQAGDAHDLAMMIDSLIKTRIAESNSLDPQIERCEHDWVNDSKNLGGTVCVKCHASCPF